MNVAFAGTPSFAAVALAQLHDAGYSIALVLTQPDRPAGRGQKIMQSAVRALAAAHRIPVHQPERLATDEQLRPLLAHPADVMVVAAYGLILPPGALAHPRHGCFNIHASLLPRWRGAAPIQRAILAGDATTGVCIMRMDAGLDSGPVVSADPVRIEREDTAGTLQDRLADVGAAAIVRALAALQRAGAVEALPQPSDGIIYASKISKGEARIDWSRDAAHIRRQVRAFNPVPGAFTTHGGLVVKVWRTSPAPLEGPASPGPGRFAVAKGMLAVGCGDGRSLVLDEVQPAGGRRMAGPLFLNGRLEFMNDGFGT